MSSTTNLETGSYYIQSVATGKYIGRHWAEDRSLLPKKVIQRPEDWEPTPWKVVKQDDGTYTLTIGGGPTGAINSKLFAILLDVPPPEHWKIFSPERNEEDEFVIMDKREEKGWIVPDSEDYTQIVVHNLIIGPSDPPFFPANEVFKFTPAKDDVAEE
ncbi:hypothetical protein BXZ70DRAFT_459498 [Cristinia sonorae]|uniref:Uncharacterized protein n=1 Tax=Cristinia sonorae TaxID=1940300 RepID=A0A8K0UJ44_9AGAR|nr:hypothetical protein BXZ70DRAFT_459498 [Cristinia sonorae]